MMVAPEVVRSLDVASPFHTPVRTLGMSHPEILRLTFPDLGALQREITSNLRYGRVFVGQVLKAPVLTEGLLVIVHPVHGRELKLHAQIVMINPDGPMRGTGLALRAFGQQEVEQVEAFARDSNGAARPGASPPTAAKPAAAPAPAPVRPAPHAAPVRPVTPMSAAAPTRQAPAAPPRRPTSPQMHAVAPQQARAAPAPAAAPKKKWVAAQEMPLTAAVISRVEERVMSSARQPEPVAAPSQAVTVRPRGADLDEVTAAVVLSREDSQPIEPSALKAPPVPADDWSDFEDLSNTKTAAAARPEPKPKPKPKSDGEDDWSDFEHGPEPVTKATPAIAPKTAPPEPPPMAAAAVPALTTPRVANDVDEDDWSDFEHGPATLGTGAATARPEPESEPASAQASLESAPAPSAPQTMPPQPTPPQPLAAGAEEDDWSDFEHGPQSPAEPTATEPPAAGEADLAEPIEAAAESAEDSPADDGEAEFEEELGFEPSSQSPELQSSNRQERLRSLSVVEQLKIARKGELQDRVVVERLYGKTVWEALLQNPRITLPEVARIARKGTVPRPLLEVILENGSWLKAPNVRRALLSNPKITNDGVLKLLRLTPAHELKVMEKGTAFPMAVRDAARKLLREGER